ncbi:hypothetical protein G6011_06431 [Alternaria panax]|uniref:GH16 domain-containing protein n=1 Tax=Alternaria panax TaxID=48097 RepID=A0AAD4FGH6_9PLEO|nr:hypothetical protein G6011_06431 [Alternaria panax]
MAILRTLVAVASVVSLTTGYDLKAKYDASNFFDDDSFRFHNGWDKFTQGLALYVSKEEATRLGLARIEDGKVHLGVDTDQVLIPQEPGEGYGRKSVRLEGVQTFDNGLFIVDFDHLPSGCGMWPAFRLLHDNAYQEDWYSEFDIIEGVSKNSWNMLSLHTAHTPCKMRDNGGTGQASSNHHGGVWAAQFENDGIKAWFFARGSEPSDLHGDHPDPSRWGEPVMNFVGDSCDIRKSFKKMKIILNITFCGKNAGSDTWSGYSGCAAETHDDSCNHFVATNPGKFKEVFYLINSVRVYQNGADGGYPENSLASAMAQTFLTSTTTTEQAFLPVTTTIIITSTKLVTLPATMTHGADCGAYDPSSSATVPTTLTSFYGKHLSALASEADSGVVVVTTFITTTKIMTLPATLTGGKNYSGYDLSAPSVKPTGTTIGGIHYSPYDPSATPSKPIGTMMDGVTDYTTIQTYRVSSTASELGASTATEAASIKAVHAWG